MNKMDFTQSERAFLERQNISIDEIYDARGCSTGKEAARQAKDAKCLFFVGGALFKKGVCTKNHEHRIKARNNQCIQCKTRQIQEIRSRTSEVSYIYIAGSLEKKLLKVGITKNVIEREGTLNSFRYANTSDWKILTWAKINNAGEAETKIDKALNKFKSPAKYFKEGKQQDADEIYACSMDKLYDEYKKVISNYKVYDNKEIDLRFCKRYVAFPNILSKTEDS